MKICIAGKNNIAVECMRYLIDELGIEKERIVACFNKTDDGVDTFQRSFKKYCKEESITEIALRDLYELDNFLFFSLEFDRIIQPHRMQTNKVFNIHFSLLPKYQGMYTSVWPILFGDNESGVTLHCIDNGIDTGEIIEQITFPLSRDETARSLYLKYIDNGTILFKKMIVKAISGNYQSTPQSLNGASYFSKDALNFSEVEIDLNKPSREVRNQIRAFSFREYQLPKIDGVAIEGADILTNRSTEQAGKVIREDLASLDVATIDFDVRCYKSDSNQ